MPLSLIFSKVLIQDLRDPCLSLDDFLLQLLNRGLIFPETHWQGKITLDNMPEELKAGGMKGDLGVQVAKDGRVWVCINGIAFLRFTPEEE